MRWTAANETFTGFFRLGIRRGFNARKEIVQVHGS
jgi:hypothetical protein